MPPISIRPAVDDDVPEVIAFWATAAENDDRPPDSGTAVRGLLARDPAALLLAEDGGRIIGTVVAGWDGWRCHLYRLAVHPDHRRRGIAGQLVAAAEECFVALGGSRAGAMVLEGNTAAHRAWEALGYAAQAPWRRWVKPL